MTFPRAPIPMLVSVAIAAGAGCGGVSSRPLSDASAPEEQTLSFEEDGVSREAFGAAVASLVIGSRGQLFNLQAAYQDGKGALTITVARNPGPITVGSYPCGPTAAILHSSFSPPVTHSGAAAGGSCTIVLTAVGSREGERVSGTFSGVLASGGSSKTIAAGRFSLPLTIVAAP